MRGLGIWEEDWNISLMPGTNGVFCPEKNAVQDIATVMGDLIMKVGSDM